MSNEQLVSDSVASFRALLANAGISDAEQALLDEYEAAYAAYLDGDTGALVTYTALLGELGAAAADAANTGTSIDTSGIAAAIDKGLSPFDGSKGTDATDDGVSGAGIAAGVAALFGVGWLATRKRR